MRKKHKINPLEWIGWLFSPIQQNGAFFVFMFALGWICTQLELMPYFLRNKGAEPYELTVPELFLDIYIVCCLLMLIPKKIRIWVKALLYVFFYGVALVDMFCYERFESTLTPTMLMLVQETTGQEAQEFLSGYLSWDIVQTGVGWILLLIGGHLLWTLIRWLGKKMTRRMILPKVNEPLLMMIPKVIMGLLVGWCLYSAVSQTWDNKTAMKRLFSYDTIGQVEHELTKKDCAKLYIPVYRLAFGLYANGLADTQLDQLKAASDKVVVDSCCYRVPNIVVVIGESYNKHHSQLYGYNKPTTPRQVAMEAEGSLVKFTDVVSPWNLTSFVFKHMMSLYTVGDSGEWCDYPLFPEVFRKAGYHVTFITNQFQSKAKEAVYDFSGGFFLNDPELSHRQFDKRSTRTYRFDDGVLKEFDRGVGSSDHSDQENRPHDHNLVILHLMGSHVDYRSRYPLKTHTKFRPSMYNRPELNDKQKQILSYYDNSLLYNDSIVYAVTRRFADKDAVVIYVPDHGEEIFDGEPYMYGRMHGANIDYRLARNEMEIPFWVWGSDLYRERHPYGWMAIQNAKNRPMMTDVLPHFLMYLGGISSPLYRSEYNVISPDYDVKRPRILKNVTDYNGLKVKK